jgi:type I restriction-modification system DNA methylase subunit
LEKIQLSTEEEILAILLRAVDEIEIYTRLVDYRELEHQLGFFFVRVLDNKVTRSKKGKLELNKAIVRAAAFIIVIQMLFYIVFSKETKRLDVTSSSIQNNIQFQKILNDLIIDDQFENILSAKIIGCLPNEAINALKGIYSQIIQIKMSKLKADIIGKIFHNLIPFELRKLLAAYYTSNIAGEFLARLAIKDPNAVILDPACGSGTLLVCAYNRIKELDNSLNHSQILSHLYGVDISAFAAQLAKINLVLQDPLNTFNRSQIAFIDTFKMKIEDNITESSLKIPKIDVLIGNPPFTRGDRLDNEYKDFLKLHLQKHGILLEYNKKYLGLYAYFLLDSQRFLKRNGVLAFVLPLSIINSLTMQPVLKFLFSRFTILYLVTSEAQITFSEECSFKEILFIAKLMKTPYHKTKFVVLKQELSEGHISNIVKIIEDTQEDNEDLNLRIRIISKKTLEETIELNWNLHFRSKLFNSVFEQIRGSKMSSHVNQIVKTPRYDVDRGFRAGVSDFFYLPNRYWNIITITKYWIEIKNNEDQSILKIPRSNLIPVFRKSSLYNRVVPQISEFVLITSSSSRVDENIEKYRLWGYKKFGKDRGFENLAYNQVKRKRKIARTGISHEISLKSNRIIAFYSPIPVFMSDNFIFIRTFNEENDKILSAYLNSSVFLLTYLILRREKTGALGQIFGTDLRNFFCLDPRKVNNNDKKDLLQIFDQFINESPNFPSLLHQIQKANKNKNNIRFRLDFKICELLAFQNIPLFLKQLYEILNEDLSNY